MLSWVRSDRTSPADHYLTEIAEGCDIDSLDFKDTNNGSANTSPRIRHRAKFQYPNKMIITKTIDNSSVEMISHLLRRKRSKLSSPW
jgi:hypothetical protein